MQKHEYLIALATLLVAFGAQNYSFGRSRWHHEKLAKWLSSLIDAFLVLAAGLYTLLAYLPEFIDHIDSPVNIIIAVIFVSGLSTLYRHCFMLGDRSVYRQPDPNQPYEVDDIPPMPTNMTPATK